jgi:hypothetical protein
MVRCALALIAVIASARSVSAAPAAHLLVIHVPADAPTDLPVFIDEPMDVGRYAAMPRMIAELPSRQTVPVQFVPPVHSSDRPLTLPGRLYVPLILKEDDRGKIVTIALKPAQATVPPPVTIKVLQSQATQFFDGPRLVLQYNHGPKDLNGKDDPNAVLGFAHPIHGLDGELFSQNSPLDHLHHRGLFWAWTRLKRDGKLVGSWWDRQDIRYHIGRILHRDEGPVLATVSVEGFWDYQTKDMSKPERLVREVVTIRVFDDALTANADYQAIDVDLDLYAMVDGLTMAGTDARSKGYGGFTLRLPAPKEGVRITADGKRVPKDANMYRAYWADYSGNFPQATKGQSGVAILTHPKHPGSPPPWCLRYYGPMNPSYPGLDFVPLRQDRPLRLHYRLVLHRGTADRARIAEIYKLYATNWATGVAAQPAVTSQP